MTPDEAIAEATNGALRPVYLVLGEERFLVDQVTHALRVAATKNGIAGFNEDKFTAGETPIDRVMSAVKTAPMMAPLRLVMLRSLERWEAKRGEDEGGDARKNLEASPLDQLAEYARDPVKSTILVLVAAKLHGQRRIVTAAKKGGFLVACDPLHPRAMPDWIENACRGRGHAIAPGLADLLAQMAGTDLSTIDDALERLSLFVGPSNPITEEAVAAVVTRVRQSTVWELLDALGARRLDRALVALGQVYDSRDSGLPLLGSIAWSIRQMIKFSIALQAGADPMAAAQRAGVAPFKARDMAQAVRSIPMTTMERWLRLMAEADLALKGSKRTGQAVLEAMIVAMCEMAPPR